MFIYAFISSICIFMLLAMFVLLYPYLSVKVKDTYENLISKRAEAGIIGDENDDLNNVNANDDTLNENNNDPGNGTGKDITINPVYDIKVNATSVDITFDFPPDIILVGPLYSRAPAPSTAGTGPAGEFLYYNR